MRNFDFSSEIYSKFLILIEEQSALVKSMLFLPIVTHSVRVKPEKMFKPDSGRGTKFWLKQFFCISHWSLFFISNEAHMQNARIVRNFSVQMQQKHSVGSFSLQKIKCSEILRSYRSAQSAAIKRFCSWRFRWTLFCLSFSF